MELSDLCKHKSPDEHQKSDKQQQQQKTPTKNKNKKDL